MSQSRTADALLDVAEIETGVSDDLQEKQLNARTILGGALFVGILADVLLRADDLGLNLAICLLALLGAVGVLTARRLGGLRARQLEPMAAAAVLAVFLAIRSDELLAFATTVAALGAIALAGLMAAPGGLDPLSRLRTGETVRRFASVIPAFYLGAAPFLFEDAPYAFTGHRRHLLAARHVLRATAVAIAVGSLFSVILSAGDAVFEKTAATLFSWDLGALGAHIVWTAAFAWPVIGCLRRLTRPPHQGSLLPTVTLGASDTTAVLMSINLVFVAFLAVQVRVLFGGQAYVHSVTGLTLAEYARSGFFALAVATGLVLVVLMLLDGLDARGSLAATPRHRALSRSLVVMVALMLGSSFWRMQLYIDSYGASLDRLYAMIAMSWIAVALGGFAWTVLRGRPGFTGFAIRSAWVTLLAVHLANPAARVTAENMSRATAGAAFDFAYHARLSADAAPLVVEQLRRTWTASASPVPYACNAAGALLARFGPATTRSFKSWTAARAGARRAVAENAGWLQARACAPGDSH